MRCMADAMPVIGVDAREIEQPGDAEELHSPYFEGAVVDLAAWARDALVLAMPAQIVCTGGLPGPVLGVRREPERGRPGGAPPRRAAPTPRWAKLRDLKLG